MKTHILKYNLVSVFILFFGGIVSFFVGDFFEQIERRNLSIQYEDSFDNFISKVRERFNTALVPSVMAKTLELYEISKNDFVDIATTSSLRTDIEISVYSLKVDSNERKSFEHHLTDIYGFYIPIVDGHFNSIPDNHTDTLWPIVYEYFPNNFPISLVGLDIYGEPIRNNFDEMIASDSVVISNPITFVDTGE